MHKICAAVVYNFLLGKQKSTSSKTLYFGSTSNDWRFSTTKSRWIWSGSWTWWIFLWPSTKITRWPLNWRSPKPSGSLFGATHRKSAVANASYRKPQETKPDEWLRFRSDPDWVNFAFLNFRTNFFYRRHRVNNVLNGKWIWLFMVFSE